MSKNLETIQKISKVLGVITKVLFIMTMVGAVCSLAALVFMFVCNGNADMVTKIESNGKYTMGQIIGYCIIGVVVCITHLIVLKAHRNYFLMEQKAGTPFTTEGAKAFRALGIMNIVAPMVCIIVSSIIASVSRIGDEIHMEAGIGIGVAMILLSFVLAYGAELEKK